MLDFTRELPLHPALAQQIPQPTEQLDRPRALENPLNRDDQPLELVGFRLQPFRPAAVSV